MKKIVYHKVVRTVGWCVATVVLICLFSLVFSTRVKAAEKLLGTCTISAYSPACNTPAGSRETCTGNTARAYHTIAVDMHDPLCNYGCKLKVEGIDAIFVVEDCGNFKKYGRDLDIFFDTPAEVDDWGVRDRKVYLITEDSKKVEKKVNREKVDKVEKEDTQESAVMQASTYTYRPDFLSFDDTESVPYRIELGKQGNTGMPFFYRNMSWLYNVLGQHKGAVDIIGPGVVYAWN